MIINTIIYRNLILRSLPLIKEMIYYWCCSITQLLFNNSNSLWPHGLQHTRLPCPSPSPGACSNSCPLSQWCYLSISSSVVPSPPAFSLSQHQGLFQRVSSSHQVAKILELQLQHQSFPWIFGVDFLWDWLVDFLAVQGTLKSLLLHHNSEMMINFMYQLG